VGQRIRRYVKRALAAAVLLAAAVWTADWLVLRHTVAQDGDAFGEVEVHYRYAVHLKNNRIEQDSAAKPSIVECVHSIFPHYDETPCWYVERHKEQFQELDGSPWRFFRGE
jgi:hypothetical protein